MSRRLNEMEPARSHVVGPAKRRKPAPVLDFRFIACGLTYIPHFDSRNSGELAAPGGADG